MNSLINNLVPTALMNRLLERGGRGGGGSRCLGVRVLRESCQSRMMLSGMLLARTTGGCVLSTVRSSLSTGGCPFHKDKLVNQNSSLTLSRRGLLFLLLLLLLLMMMMLLSCTLLRDRPLPRQPPAICRRLLRDDDADGVAPVRPVVVLECAVEVVEVVVVVLLLPSERRSLLLSALLTDFLTDTMTPPKVVPQRLLGGACTTCCRFCVRM
jgi:hypothetical protein